MDEIQDINLQGTLLGMRNFKEELLTRFTMTDRTGKGSFHKRLSSEVLEKGQWGFGKNVGYNNDIRVYQLDLDEI